MLLAVGAWPLAHVFTSDPAVVSRATVALVLLALAQPAAGVAMSLDGVLIGAADYRFLGAAAGLSALAFLPAGRAHPRRARPRHRRRVGGRQRCGWWRGPC